MMAEYCEEFSKDRLINMMGGCCGTTPQHIEAIAIMAAKYEPRPLLSSRSRSCGSRVSRT